MHTHTCTHTCTLTWSALVDTISPDAVGCQRAVESFFVWPLRSHVASPSRPVRRDVSTSSGRRNTCARVQYVHQMPTTATIAHLDARVLSRCQHQPIVVRREVEVDQRRARLDTRHVERLPTLHAHTSVSLHRVFSHTTSACRTTATAPPLPSSGTANSVAFAMICRARPNEGAFTHTSSHHKCIPADANARNPS
jgi:hypothetical protein